MECKKTLRKQPMALLPIWIAALLISVMPAQAAAPTKEILVLGRITDNPEKRYAGTKAMAEYLATKLKDVGIKEVQVVITKDADEMVEHMRAGRVDLISETIFYAARLIDEGGAQPFLTTHRKGSKYHRIVFFTRKDSPIKSLADLRGRIVAFEDETSTAGYFMPGAEIVSQGFALTRLTSPRQAVPENTIGYVFSGEEINAALMVHKKVVHAGVLNSGDFLEEGSMPADVKDDIRVFHESIDFPRSLILVAHQLSPVLKEKLKKVLIQATTDPQAVSVLKAYYAIAQIEPLDEKVLKAIEEGRRLSKIVQTQLE